MAIPNYVDLDYNQNPIERLQQEICWVDANSMGEIIGNYLLEKLKKEPVLAQCYKDRKITLEGIISYINECANKKLGGKNGAIADNEVFGWVLHYVQDEKIEIKPVKSIKVDTKEQDQDKEEKKRQKKIEKERKEREKSGQMSLFDF